VFEVDGGRSWNFDFEGSVAGLESVRKTGAGRARLGALDLSPSEPVFSFEAGDLLLVGHLDLGADGALQIASEAARLIFGSGGNNEYGKLPRGG